jgi:HEAT repeat protein
VAPLVCAARDAALVERRRGTWRGHPFAVRPFPAGALPAAGDAEALQALRSWIVAEDAATRASAARALECAGLAAQAEPLLHDDDASLRLFALEALASEGPGDAATTGLLRQALGDPVAGVRHAALAALVERGDPGAEDLALEALRGDAEELEAGLAALQRAWDVRPELAERALAILIAERELRAHRGSGELASVEQALGRVPLAAATRFLCDLAREAPLGARGARADGLRDHRWYVLKAGNARAIARPVLIERWEAEPDPQRRMDFVEAIGFARDPDVVAFLLRALERPDLHPYEVLHLALTAVRQEATERVAPALKRATLEVAHARVRPALNCLLWEWY